MSLMNARALVRAAFFTLLLFTAVNGYIDRPELQAQEIDFQEIQTDLNYSLEKPAMVYFRDRESWENFLVLNFGDISKNHADLDFDKYMIIGVFMGRQEGACENDANVIRNVEKKDGRLEVHLGNLNIQDTCEHDEHPYQLIKVPDMAPEVRFTGSLPDTLNRTG